MCYRLPTSPTSRIVPHLCSVVFTCTDAFHPGQGHIKAFDFDQHITILFCVVDVFQAVAAVIASGGVREIADIKKLGELGVEAVIIGRALYEGTLKLSDAINAAR